MTPFFSICIPQYNRTSFLIEACRVLAAQRFREFEVCISDDVSNDGREMELKRFLENSGLAYVYKRQERNLRYDGNLRAAIALATGRYCLLMGNDDCLASEETLEQLHAALVAAGCPDVAITNYQDFQTHEISRRVRRPGRSAGGPETAVREFRNFSFVSGVLLDRESAQRHATERWDGSEMVQMYLACRMLAAGGAFYGWETPAIRKDIRMPNEDVDSYARRPRVSPCPIMERRLPMNQIVRVTADAIAPYNSAPDQERRIEDLADQLLFFTYPFWIFEYRRVQSWRYAAGVCLGMRPKNLLQGLTLSSVRRARLWLLHAGVTAIGLALPVSLFQRLKRPLYRLSKAAFDPSAIFIRGLYVLQDALRLIALRLGVKYTSFFPVRALQSLYVRSVRDISHRDAVDPLRVLVVSQLSPGSTSHSRLKALRRLFGNVEAMDVIPFTQTRGIGHLNTNQIYAGERVRALNALILEKAATLHPDLLWVDRGLHVLPSTLRALKANGLPWMIHYTPDNHQVPGNQNRHFFQNVPLYDVQVTTKSADVPWLISIGARRVELVDKAFDPDIHRPLTLSPEDQARFGCDVGFVGHWELPREELLLWLTAEGIGLRIWGGGWQHARAKINPLFQNAPHVVGDDYAKAIQGAKIQLCLVSTWVRDRKTARSIEIPACGTFMLAERTPEHQALFKEGIEAEFYATREELLEKIRYYLSHPEERERIAQAGRARCVAGYRSEDRLRELFARLNETMPIGKVA